MRAIFFAIFCYFVATEVFADENCAPEGLLLTALTDGAWHLYISDSKCNWDTIKTDSEPRTPAFSSVLQRLAYVSADGSVREVDLKTRQDTVLFKADKQDSYTQLAYDLSGQSLYMVKLKEGSSADSDISRWQRASGRVEPILNQRSAQFEPFVSQDILYYGNVSCTIACGSVIQEIWQFHLIGQTARQLTLLNATSRQPFVDKTNNRIFFSSNKNHYFHIWSHSVKSGESVPLTEGNVTDYSPVVAGDELLFIRKSSDGTRLMHMRLKDGAEVKAISLKFAHEDIKDLRYGGV